MKKGCRNCYKFREHCWRWQRYMNRVAREPEYCAEWRWFLPHWVLPLLAIAVLCAIPTVLILGGN